MKKLQYVKNNFNLEQIEKFMKDNNMSVKKFCRIARISESTYNKIFSGRADFSLAVVFKLATAMKIHPRDVFYRSKFIDN